MGVTARDPPLPQSVPGDSAVGLVVVGAQDWAVLFQVAASGDERPTPF